VNRANAIWPISRPIPAPLPKYRCCVRCISRRSARPISSGYALGRARLRAGCGTGSAERI
jgi:hypothetical protein